MAKIKNKLPYPMIAVLAYDWTIYEDSSDIRDVIDESRLTTAWIYGAYLGESDECIVVGHEVFTRGTARRRESIPKSNIIKKIIYRGKK